MNYTVKISIYLLIAILFAPLFSACLFVLGEFTGNKVVLEGMDHLIGVGVAKVKPTLNLREFYAGTYQKGLEDWIAYEMPMGAYFVKMNNQFFYTVFNKSYMYNGNIIIGKNAYIFEKTYLDHYCGFESVPIAGDLAEYARKIHLLQNSWAKRGKLLLFVITPSKVSYFPEYLPGALRCNNPAKRPAYEALRKALSQAGVNFVDGAEITLRNKGKHGYELFPRGGTHWNLPGAVLTMNEILSRMHRSGLPKIPEMPLKFRRKPTAEAPLYAESDLVDILNLALKPLDYEIFEFLNPPAPMRHPKLRLSIVGGSFTLQFLDIFGERRLFDSLDHFLYFRLDHTTYGETGRKRVGPVDPENRSTYSSIAESDIVILEENEQNIYSNHGRLILEKLMKSR